MSSEPSRRRFLAGAGAAGLLAGPGCLRRLQAAATTVDYPATPAPDYRRWLPAPGTLPDGETYDAMHLRLADLVGNDDVPGQAAGLRNLFARTGRAPLGVDPGRIRAVVKVALVEATTLLGSFDPGSVGAAARKAGYERTGTHRGFELYERADEPHALAASGTAIVQARHDEAATVARRVVDAGRGEVDRYHEVDDGFERLSDAVGGTLSWVHGGEGFDPPAGVVRSATGQALVDGRVFFALVYRFESAEAATAAAIREAAAGNGRLPRMAPLDVTVDGRLGRAEFARDAASVLEERPLQPIVAWAFDREATAGRVTVTHRAGDPVRADRLSLRTDDGPTGRQFADDHGTVRPGDAVTVSVETGEDLRVVWEVAQSASTMAASRGGGRSRGPSSP
jgi:hypothetical protein